MNEVVQGDLGWWTVQGKRESTGAVWPEGRRVRCQRGLPLGKGESEGREGRGGGVVCGDNKAAAGGVDGIEWETGKAGGERED